MIEEASPGVEIALRGIRRGPPRARKSPLTGEQETYAELEMNDAEYHAATSLMARYGAIDEYGEGLLELATAQVEVWGFDYDGCMMRLLGELRCASDFVFALATAAHLVVQFESAGGPSALVTTPASLDAARALDPAALEGLGPILLAADPAAFCRALAGFDARGATPGLA